MNNDTRHKHDEQLMRELFKSFEPKHAPHDLNKRIMQQVMSEWAVKPKVKSVIRWKMQVVYVVIVVLALGVLAFLFDYFALHGFANYLSISTENSQLQFFYENIRQVGEWINLIPSVIVYGTVAIAVLFGVDNLVTRYSKMVSS